MGTNYYLACTGGSQHRQPQHIGKSLDGWCFSLRVDPANGIYGLSDWQARWAQSSFVISDEDGNPVSPTMMLGIISKREHKRVKRPPSCWREWLNLGARSHIEPGPYRLVRHRLDGLFCIGHGEGTWDLIAGEFS